MAKKNTSINLTGSVITSTGSISNITSTTNPYGGSVTYPYNNTTTFATSQWAVPKDPCDLFSGKVLNLQKIEEMTAERRGIVLSLIGNLGLSNDKVKELIISTLEVYGLFENKDTLTRKIKIENVIK